MTLFRNVRRPSKDASFDACVDFAARRDPVGHRFHLCLACLALATMLLSSSLASISSTLLIGYATLRAPTIWRTWRTLPINPVIFCALGFYVWLVISLSWSPDPSHGARLLRGSRYLLLIPALLPMMCHVNVLLWALVIGTLIQFIAQITGMTFGSGENHGGLSKHPGFTAIWCSISLGALIFTTKTPSRKTLNVIVRSIASLLVLSSLLITAARSAVAATILGLIAGSGLFLFRTQKKVSPLVVSIALSCVLLAGFAIGSQTRLPGRLHEAYVAISTPYDGGEFHMDQTRPLWWRIGLNEWFRNPVQGSGLGSASIVIPENQEVRDIVEQNPANTKATRDDYHSLYVTVLADSGLIGAILLSAWFGLLLQRILASEALAPLLLVGFITFLGYSFFNTTIFTGRLVAFMAILMAFCVIKLPPQIRLREMPK